MCCRTARSNHTKRSLTAFSIFIASRMTPSYLCAVREGTCFASIERVVSHRWTREHI